MDIYCGNCNSNVGLQTNEEYNEMFERLRLAELIIETLNEKATGKEYGLDAEAIWEECKEYYDKYKGEL